MQESGAAQLVQEPAAAINKLAQYDSHIETSLPTVHLDAMEQQHAVIRPVVTEDKAGSTSTSQCRLTRRDDKKH